MLKYLWNCSISICKCFFRLFYLTLFLLCSSLSDFSADNWNVIGNIVFSLSNIKTHSKYIFICSFGFNYLLPGRKQISCSSIGLGEVHNKVCRGAGGIVESKYNRKGSQPTNTHTDTQPKLSGLIHYTHFRTKIEYFLNFILSPGQEP